MACRNHHLELDFTWLKRYAPRHFSSVTNQWSPIKISVWHQGVLSRQFLIEVNYNDRPPKHLTRQSIGYFCSCQRHTHIIATVTRRSSVLSSCTTSPSDAAFQKWHLIFLIQICDATLSRPFYLFFFQIIKEPFDAPKEGKHFVVF